MYCNIDILTRKSTKILQTLLMATLTHKSQHVCVHYVCAFVYLILGKYSRGLYPDFTSENCHCGLRKHFPGKKSAPFPVIPNAVTK